MNDPRVAARKALRNARRESLFVAVIVVFALVWTLGYCAIRGYHHSPESWLVSSGLSLDRTAESLTTYVGIPDWVFFGIVVPWSLCTVATIVLSLRGMADDDLGIEHEGADDNAP